MCRAVGEIQSYLNIPAAAGGYTTFSLIIIASFFFFSYTHRQVVEFLDGPSFPHCLYTLFGGQKEIYLSISVLDIVMRVWSKDP